MKIVKTLLAVVVILGIAVFIMVQPVYYNYKANIAIHVLPDALKEHVKMLSQTNPPRGNSADNLDISAAYIKRQFERYQGKFGKVNEYTYQLQDQTYRNVSLLYGDGVRERIVIGAHYDSYQGLSGADDNASGVAALLELAKLLADRENNYDIELVAYTLEEPPHFGSANMGSMHHASALSKNDISVVLMLSLEMLGYYSEEPGSQSYPMPGMSLIYPNKGNYIALVSNLASMMKLRSVKLVMQSAMDFPVYSLTAPSFVPGVDFSDHMPFWDQGFPAIMVTDTAFYRNLSYHTESDTLEKLDFKKMAQVVDGVFQVVSAFDDN